MGIPTFFRSILNGNKRVIQGAAADVLSVDYFFMDYNSVIYKEWGDIPSDVKRASSQAAVEKILISRVVDRTVQVVNQVVKPSVLAYLSMDGPAPRAKMVQQRSRRFKSVHSAAFLTREKQRLDPRSSEASEGETTTPAWDPSCHICPGTPFMERLSRSLQKAMATGRFSCSVTLSDGNNPGEGEHKILPRVRALREQEPDTTVVIYSPDGDMISLALMTQKSRIYILRFADPMSEHESGLLEKGFELLYCSMDMVRSDFFRQMTRTYSDRADPERILLDYNFLLAMVGNDFVPSLPFLKIRSGGLDLLLEVYNRLRPSFNDYLVGLPCTVHPGFFKAILLELSKMENAEMRKEYSMLMREYHGSENQRRKSREALMTPKERLESRYYHLSMFHPDHPLASTYRKHHDAVDYRKDKHVWKGQYYKYFCDFHPEDFKRYNSERTALVTNYLESLMFTLRYYTQGCPSWNWCYKYRVAPLPSDVHTVLETSASVDTMNRIVFEKGSPYTPFQQLLMILPPDSVTMLPANLRTIPTSSKWSFLYPREFEVDALAGNKYIYSEAILPENTEEESFLRHVRLLETQLSPKDQARNIVSTKVRKFVK